MRILADTNVPEEYVSALKGDGHEITYTREIDELGPEATDTEIARHAESVDAALLSTDVKDFGDRQLDVPVLVAPQDMTGGEVRAATARIESLPFDPAMADPLWLSTI